MKTFLRYNSRHSLFFPGNWQRPILDSLCQYSHVKNKDGQWTNKRTKTFHEPLWMMKLRHRLFCVSGHHFCKRRGELSNGDSPDTWDLGPDGYRTCSYCGSLHEDDFWNIAEKYIAGDPNYEVSFTDKSYKVYARKRSTVNASLGGIKFYLHHVDTTHPDMEQRKSRFSELYRVHQARFQKILDESRLQAEKVRRER